MTSVIAALAAPISVAAGGSVAFWMHRRTRLSPHNAYAAWGLCVALVGAASAIHSLPTLGGALTLLLGATTAAVLGRRWRVAALGAGGELRDHERARIMVWTAMCHRRRRPANERVYIAGQGELVRERPWPGDVRSLPMTGHGKALLPLGEGHHQLFVGATGSGKTTSARRVLLARGLGDACVDGRLEWREWEQDDTRRHAIEIIADSVQFLGGRDEQPAANARATPAAA